MPIQRLSTLSACPLAYSSATSVHRSRALEHTWQLLRPVYPAFTRPQWSFLFDEYDPDLWVDDSAQTAVLTLDALRGFTPWVKLFYNESNIGYQVTYGTEALYLAQQVVSWSQQASELLTTDPDLKQPDSIRQMRALFHRLSIGHSVAERICRSSQKSCEPIH
jgi:hypothetical protein